MANIVEQFIQNIREMAQKSPEELQEMAASQERKKAINARSGDNIRFYGGTNPGKEYSDVLSDAIKFYQTEFKMTPHATIANDPDVLRNDNVLGATTVYPDETGQYSIDFRHLSDKDVKEGEEAAKIGEATGSHPKNSGDIRNTPIHELGHALFGTLFPPDDTSSNRKGEYYEGEFYPVLADDLYWDALNDIGVEDDDVEKQEEKTREISGYAWANPAETVAESLVDYYYNRNEAAPLSRAIINRLKSAGSMYGIRQTGGFDLDSSADNFMRNLRRYKVIQ